MVLGPITGGWIGEHFGLRAVYFVAAGIFLLSTLFIFFIQSQPIDHHDPEAPPSALRKNPRFIAYLVVVAFAVFAMYLPQPLTPNFVNDVRGFSLGNVGIIFAMGALGNALLALFLSRFDAYIGYIMGQALVAAFAFIIWRATTLPLLALGYFLLGGFRASRPLALAQARELVHESQMGLTYGVIETVSAVIFILTPPLAGYLYKINPTSLYPLSLGLLAGSILVSLIVPRRLVHA
jgi:MFS family permease